jgi:hypothetical protein
MFGRIETLLGDFKLFWERNTQQKKILKSIWIEGEAKELNTTK